MPFRPGDTERIRRSPDDARHFHRYSHAADLGERVIGAGIIIERRRAPVGGPLVSPEPVLADNDRVGRDRANLLDEAAEVERNLRIDRAIVGVRGRDGLGLSEIIKLHHPRHNGPAWDCQTSAEAKPAERISEPKAMSRQFRACTRAEPMRSSHACAAF